MLELLVVRIPGSIEPLERGDRFEDPLNKALKKLGGCVGGGTAFETSPEFRVTGCDIDVEVKDLAKALPLIRDTFTSANAPAGTTVTHADSRKVLLRFTKSGVREFAPSKKVVKKSFVDSCPWQRGEVLAYRLAPNRYVLLHVCGFGQTGPVFWVPEWCGSNIPGHDELRQIVLKEPEYYRLGAPYEAWRSSETDRDERRLTRTGLTVPPRPKGQRFWFPGSLIRWWKSFERMLKELFGVVKVSPAVRLSHELGLWVQSVHVAVWQPAGAVTKADAKRQFYAQASDFRRSHPERKRYAATEELKAFVAALKSAFDGKDVWNGTFRASEGYVVVPIVRTKARVVLPVIARLASEHRLACYYPETEKLTQAQR